MKNVSATQKLKFKCLILKVIKISLEKIIEVSITLIILYLLK